MARNSVAEGPQFVQYFGPVLEALTALGGSGQPSEVKDWIVQQWGITQEELDERNASGTSKFGNRVDWAKFYLS